MLVSVAQPVHFLDVPSIATLLEAEDKAGVVLWYSRVFSNSNVADAPSRGEVGWHSRPSDIC